MEQEAQRLLFESPAPFDFQDVLNQSRTDPVAKTLDLDIIGEIGWDVTAAGIQKALREAGAVKEISVTVHSPGGSVFEGFFIYSALKQHPARVTVNVFGLAASAASWVPLAASPSRLFATKVGFFMAHNSRTGVFGEAADLEKQAALLRKLDIIMSELYASRSGRPAEEWRDMMAATTQLTAAEALELGLVDKVMSEDPDKKPEALEAPHVRNLLGDLPPAAARFLRDPVARESTIFDQVVEALRAEPQGPILDTPPSYLEELAAQLTKNGETANA